MSIVSLIGLDSVVQQPRISILLLLVFLSCFSLVIISFYRLYLCPIAKIPGPKLAALTFWYEFYYDAVQGGQYEFEIERMHDKYGPVVRINPEEVHVMDPDFYEILYSGGNKRRNKWHWAYQSFGIDNSGFATVDHEHHRLRRSILNPFFSKRAVAKLEPTIKECVENMCVRFREWQQSREPLRIRDAFAALTSDIITQYCFDFSLDSLNHPDFNAERVRSADKLTTVAPIGKQFKWIFPSIKIMPDWLAVKLLPTMANTLHVQSVLRGHASRVVNSDPAEINQNDSTLFHRILQSDLGPEEKSTQRLVEESQAVIFAGQLTTADTLERAVFELLANPDVLAKLETELRSAMPNSNQLPSLQQLEQLPYLSAVITEALRITTPAPTRFQRIAPDEDLVVQGFTLPAGTPIGMSTYLMHYRNPSFPDPEKFKPERWLAPATERRELDKHFVPFSKGTRICLGKNLAEAELYLAIAALFRRFNMELFETTIEEVRYCRDYTVSMPYEGSERARVIFKD